MPRCCLLVLHTQVNALDRHGIIFCLLHDTALVLIEPAFCWMSAAIHCFDLRPCAINCACAAGSGNLSFQCAGRAVLACAAPIPETILVWENKCLLPGYRRLPGDGCCHPCAGTRLHIGSRLALGLPDHHGDSQHRQDQRAELVSPYNLRLCSAHRMTHGQFKVVYFGAHMYVF